MLKIFVLSVVIILAANCESVARSSYFSYEIKSNSIDDGNKVITKYQSKKYDSASMQVPIVDRKTIISPSKYLNSNKNNWIHSKQLQTNQIGTGYQAKIPIQVLASYFNNAPGNYNKVRASSAESAQSMDWKTMASLGEQQDDRKIHRKQLQTNHIDYDSNGHKAVEPMQVFNFNNKVRGARSVESPAYSVDSGGQASSSIAGEIAKILHVKQGHYADIYNRIDRPNITTKRPVDAIEDTMRVAVQQMWTNRQG